MTIFDDLAAEQERLEKILLGLDEAQWTSPSGAEGWTIADVVLHLAQSEEMVAGQRLAPAAVHFSLGAAPGDTMDDRAADAVRAEASGARRGIRAVAARPAGGAGRAPGGRPGRADEVGGRPLKPATLATTRLAEHWAHGLDITGPLGIDFPDTERLRHIAWLAHRTLPYALSLAGEPPAAVRCELTAPNGSDVWRFGPPDAESAITGRPATSAGSPRNGSNPTTRPGPRCGPAVRSAPPRSACCAPTRRSPFGRDAGGSQPGVDGFGLQGQDGEDALVDTPQGLAAGDAVQGLQAEGVFAQRQRAFVAEPALA